MNVLLVSQILAYICLALTLAVICVSLWLLFQSRRKGGPLLCLALSCLAGFTLMNLLMRLSLGLICYRPMWQVVLLYGAVILLLSAFLLDSLRHLRSTFPCGGKP